MSPGQQTANTASEFLDAHDVEETGSSSVLKIFSKYFIRLRFLTADLSG